ncbi:MULTISPECIES: guanylate kinase [Holospora]|uniref:Guanylate kinase n=2 Tax=Holospora TaxID=44747 RepID=A0A061JGL2_9PROT|nr:MULTISPECIES: guanylate kinase [Holospora]ETZ05215.1 guanylate kinase [Holospora undulata HU1]GAJ45844.1 guanylate kinase [Holospora elegans E1]
MLKNKNSSGIVFVLSAPSGTGKTSLCKHIAASLDHIQESVSMTTRQSRPDEQEGKDYFFVSKKDFQAYQTQARFVEWTQIHDHFYGTPLDPMMECLNQSKDVICALDQVGLQKLKSHTALNGEIVSIFVVPPSQDALKFRLEQRGQDSPEVISRRLAASSIEMHQWVYYDYVVFNDDFLMAACEIMAIIRAEKLKSVYQFGRIKKIIEEWK